jgi:16S rRNA (cytosine967-C5)-methyltransferase
VTDAELAVAIAEGGKLRALVLELWQRTRIDWGFVTDRLSQAFRSNSWLGARDRRFVGELVFGLVRHLRRVDLALSRGLRTQRAPRDLERLLALLVIEKLLPAERAARVIPELDWRAVATVDAAIAGERDTTRRIALAASLPDWLARRLVAEWGERAEPLALALNQRAPMTIRANLIASPRDDVARALADEHLEVHAGRWTDTALVVDSRTNLFGLAAFKRGLFEAQDEGSQLVADLAAACVANQPRPLVVDYCAGAGGKTLALAARLGNRGRIVASDVDTGKLDELRRRARRAGVSNTRAIEVGDRELDALLGRADVVLVDAPCTGIGALRRNPEARWRLRETDIAELALRQREILARARALCAPSGRIVYATCSLLRAENQDVVADQPGIALRELWGDRADVLGDGDSLLVTPDRHGTDGLFAHVLLAPGVSAA